MKKFAFCMVFILALSLMSGLLSCSSPGSTSVPASTPITSEPKTASTPASPALENYNRGCALFGEGKHDEAIAEYTKAIELDPNYAHAYNNRGVAYKNKGQYELAIADYNRAIELDPNYAHAYYNRGVAYKNREQYELAIADYSKAIELDPEDSSVWNSKGVCLSRLDRYEEALECYDKALQIDPDYAYAKNNKDRLIAFMAVPADTTPPSVIGNLVAAVAGNGSVNLSWDRSTAADFGYYNIYINQSMMTDVTGMTPSAQIKEIDKNTYQAVGLKLTTKYYFAVTAVDKSGNEKIQVTCVSAIPTKHMTLDVPTLVSVPDEAITRKFTWKHDGIDWYWEAKISKQLYQTLHDKPRVRLRYAKYSVYVTHSLDDVFFQKLAAALSAEAGKLGFTEHQMVELAVLFVQTIPYTKDIDSTGLQEYPRYPIETLVEGTGDCEDHAILLAELLRSMNYDAILLEYRGEHMAVGVADPGNTYGYHYTFNDKSYYYVETTATGWEIGEAPDEFRQLAYIWDLVPSPALYCEHYRWPDFTGTMPLELTICNDGTAPALGATVYAFLDAGDDKCYADASTTIDIAPEETRTVTLMLPLPGHPVQTRVGYRIFYNDRKVDEGFGDWRYFNSG